MPQTFAERFSRALKVIASIAWRPPVIALALGSMLLGTVQTCTFKNCGQKEMK